MKNTVRQTRCGLRAEYDCCTDAGEYVLAGTTLRFQP